MPVIRYEVTLPPECQAHPTAWAPLPVATISRWAAAESQGQTVHGQPGTERIPAPYPTVGSGSFGAGPGSRFPGGAGGATGAGSQYMPPAWYPSLYYARQCLWGAIGGVRIYSDNRMPHPSRPAADTRWVPGKYRRSWPWTNDRPVMAGPPLPRWRWWRRGDAPLAQTGSRPTDG